MKATSAIFVRIESNWNGVSGATLFTAAATADGRKSLLVRARTRSAMFVGLCRSVRK